MMDKLVEKAGGRSPFPLVQGDATRMPFRDEAFGGAYLRWVLHLIPAWRDALAEIVRVVRPGGVLLTSLGSYGGPRSEIQERFAELTGVSIEPPGLTWDGYDDLDAAAIALGLVPRALPPIPEIEREGLDAFIDAHRGEPVLVDLEGRGPGPPRTDRRRGPPRGPRSATARSTRSRSMSTRRSGGPTTFPPDLQPLGGTCRYPVQHISGRHPAPGRT